MQKSCRGPSVGWVKSTFCTSGACLEARLDGRCVLVRNSAEADGLILEFSALRWGELLDLIERDAAAMALTLAGLTFTNDGGFWLEPTENRGQEVYFSSGDWDAFRSGVLEGEFSPKSLAESVH